LKLEIETGDLRLGVGLRRRVKGYKKNGIEFGIQRVRGKVKKLRLRVEDKVVELDSRE
jgi:hypothetical protein